MPAHDSSTPQTTLPSAGVPHDRGLAPVLWCDGVVAPLRLKPPRVRRALPRPARAAGRPWHVRPRLLRRAAQVARELLRYAAMQLLVPGIRSRGPLRERTKSICGMVCGCNDRKHCVAGPDPPRTAGLSIIRTCQHKATHQPAQTRTVSNSCSQERVHVCVYSAAMVRNRGRRFAWRSPGQLASGP